MGRKIEMYVETDMVGSTVKETVDIELDWGMEPDSTEDEIEEAVKDWVYQRIQFGWGEVQDE